MTLKSISRSMVKIGFPVVVLSAIAALESSVKSNSSKDKAEILKNTTVYSYSEKLISDLRDEMDQGLITYTVFKEKEGEILATPSKEMVEKIKNSENRMFKEQIQRAEALEREADDFNNKYSNSLLVTLVFYTAVAIASSHLSYKESEEPIAENNKGKE